MRLLKNLYQAAARFKVPYSTMSSVKGYGSWKSPLSSEFVTEKALRFSDVHAGKSVFWSEIRFDEGGRYVVCSHDGQGVKEWTPKTFSARTLVHEYGGGAFSLTNENGLVFSNMEDGCLYFQPLADSAPKSMSPKDKGWRYADGWFSPKNNSYYCVREDHSVIESGASEAKNTIVHINWKTQAQTIVCEGCDFFASPKVSPDGKKLCWVQWDHPNMPWEATEVCVAELDPNGLVVPFSARTVAGHGNSNVYPSWTHDGRLLYVSDRTEWWNLFIHDFTEGGKDKNLTPGDFEVACPHWVFANYWYACNSEGKIAIIIKQTLNILDLSTGKLTPITTDPPFTSFNDIEWMDDNKHIVCTASSPTQFSAVVKIDSTSGHVTVVRKSREAGVAEGYISVGEEVTWPTSNNEVARGYFYAPKNQDYSAPPDTLPPLLVKVHGGPTAQVDNSLNLKITYFTSRGFAVLDTNYRGSTGYGKAYRNKLQKQWGIYDVDDCCFGAEFLAKQEKVDGNRLCIDGGSAGGYTTLACLAFRNVFKAGASHYGVADVLALAKDTHKFESRYMDSLVAPPSEEQIYKDRSPICALDQFTEPVIFFQGDEDKIVPLNQAEMMYDALRKKNVPTGLVVFKGEQHGFRKADNIQLALDGEFFFFAKVFGFTPADGDKGKPDDQRSISLL